MVNNMKTFMLNDNEIIIGRDIFQRYEQLLSLYTYMLSTSKFSEDILEKYLILLENNFYNLELFKRIISARYVPTELAINQKFFIDFNKGTINYDLLH